MPPTLVLRSAENARESVVQILGDGTGVIWKSSTGGITSQPLVSTVQLTSGTLSADIDGDGQSELLVPDATGFSIIRNPGSGAEAVEHWVIANGGANHSWTVGDFNGDGRDDALKSTPGVGAQVFLSNGTGFGSAQVWTGSGPGTDGWYAVDINGDNATDLVKYVAGNTGAEAWISNGSGRFDYGGSLLDQGHVGRWHIGDFNGDGRSDLIDDAGQLFLLGAQGFTYSGRLPGVSDQVALADINGDGKTDVGRISSSGTITFETDVLGSVAAAPRVEVQPAVPEFVYEGRLIEVDLTSFGSGYEYRLITHGDGSPVVSEWRDLNYLVTSPAGSTLGLQLQIRETGDDHLLVDSFGTDTAFVLSEEDALNATDLSRLKISEIASDVSLQASGQSWRASIDSFSEFTDYVDQQAIAAGATSEFDRSMFYVQWVSGLWHYGGLTGGPGGVFDNEVTGHVDPADASIRTYLDSPIGLCTDYTVLLGLLFEAAGINSRIILSTGHVFNEVQINGQWWVLDGQNGLAMSGTWEDVINGDNTLEAIRFSHAGMTAGTPVYGEYLMEGAQTLLSWYAASYLPGATRYELLDFYDLQHYGPALLAAVDTSGWTPAGGSPIASGPPPTGISEAIFASLVNSSRYQMSQFDAPDAHGASVAGWRSGLSDMGDLTDALIARALASSGDYAGTFGSAAQLVALAHWVGGIWSYNADAEDDQSSFAGYLSQRDASSADFAALLAHAAESLGLTSTIWQTAGEYVVEIAIDGRVLSFVPALGLVFEGDWNAARDGESQLKVWHLSLPNTAPSSPLYSDELGAARLQFTVRAGNGLIEAGQPAEGKAWVTAQPNNEFFGTDVLTPGEAPTLLSVVAGEPTTDSHGVQTLTYRLSFNGAVTGIDASDFVLTHDGAAITSVSAISGSIVAITVTVQPGRDIPDVRIVDGSGIVSTSGTNIALGSTVTIDADGSALSAFGSTRYVGSASRYDEIDYRSSLTATGGVTVDLQQNFGKGGEAEGDTYSSIEGIRGTHRSDALYGDARANVLRGEDGDDRLYGRAGKDILMGGAGADVLSGGQHADVLDGGEGIDTADYSGDFGGVWIDLSTGVGRWNYAEGDRLSGIENLIGTDWSDWLYGDHGANRLEGGLGADFLFGGNGADVLIGGDGDDVLAGGHHADILDGGEGIDTADYSGNFGGVWVNLATGIGRSNYAEGDVLIGIENLIGTDYADTFYGDQGANRLEGGKGADKLFGGAGDDILAGGHDADVLDGGDGIDTADYSGDYGGVWIDLTTGVGRWNYAEGDQLTSIENVIGTDWTDWLYGSQGANRLEGGLGADIIRGGGGNDVLIGGHHADVLDGGIGIDTADYSGDYGGVWIDLTTGVGRWNYAEGDTLTGIENLVGTRWTDWLYGDQGANRLEGGQGKDILRGGGGDDVLAGGHHADTLDGGAGVDTADYSGDFGGVWIDLTTGVGRWNYAEGDTLIGIENLIGTNWTDWLYGDNGANRLEGGQGADVLFGRDGTDTLIGGAGDDRLVGGLHADVLDGGEGNDTADYSGDFGGVWIDLSTGVGQWNYAEGDRLTSIENVIGTAWTDWLYGDNGANRLEGGQGIDILRGGGGNDVLAGGHHADVLDGGLGNDTADYSGDYGGVWIDLTTGVGRWNYAEGDTLTSIENVIGTQWTDWLYGDQGANRLEGGHGADILRGGGGDDVLAGGHHADVLDGGQGIDTADYSGDYGGVWIDLATGVGRWNYAEGDRLTGIENVIGTDWADRLYGDQGSNRLDGGGGADILIGGAGTDILLGGAGDDRLKGGHHADVLDGGEGVDIADYSGDYGGVWIDLSTGVGRWNYAEGDQLTAIENVIGTDWTDWLYGDQGSNRLDGGLGADILLGGGGNDVLIGGGGDDLFVFQAGFGHDVITDWDGNGAASGDRIKFGPGAFTSFQDVMQHATQQGGDVIITLDANNSIVLQNTLLASLHGSDFWFE